MLARILFLFALALCACGTTTTNTQPPVPAPEERSDPALDAKIDKTLKVAKELNESLEEDEQELKKLDDKQDHTKLEIKTVVLTGKPLKVDRLDLATEKGLDAFINLVRQRRDDSPTVTALEGITSYSHSLCWTNVSGSMIFRDCVLYRLDGNTAVVLHLQGGLDTIVGLFTGPEGEYTYSCENDDAMHGRSCYLVNLATGATSKTAMFLQSHPDVLVSPAGVVYLNDTDLQGQSFYDRIFTPDGIEIASSDGAGDFTFVAEAVVEKPMYEDPTWIPGLAMEYQPRRMKAVRIDLTNGRKQRIYEE